MHFGIMLFVTDYSMSSAELAMAAESGREPDSLGVSVYGSPTDLDQSKRFADNGITRSVFRLPSKKADEILPILDKATNIMRSVNG